ncbi:MAG TPA: hypothetical protein VJU61_11215 [Polyangiaceae bacterium]|nr:hypothetical protein [Polyangiaceae bacterium]
MTKPTLARLQACDLIIGYAAEAEGFLLTVVERDDPVQVVARGIFPPGFHPLGCVVHNARRHGDWQIIKGPPRRFRPLPEANLAFYVDFIEAVP